MVRPTAPDTDSELAPVPTPRRRPWRVALVLASALATFLVVVAVRDQPSPEAQLATESERDLARILANLNAEADALQAEITELKIQLAELRRSTQSEEAAAEAADELLRTLRVLAGTVPVEGPGLVVRIADPRGAVTYDALIDIVQELRDAGAEAVAVNGWRIGATTAFGTRSGRPTIDGATLSTPLTVEAIGRASTLEGGLKIPGGALDTLATLPEVSVEVQRHARIVLPAVQPGASSGRAVR